MTSDVIGVEGPEIQGEVRSRCADRPRVNARRKRSLQADLQANLRRHWRELMKPHNFIRVTAIAIPLAGFFYISISNGVFLSGSESETRSVTGEPEVWSPVLLQASVSAVGDSAVASESALVIIPANPSAGSTTRAPEPTLGLAPAEARRGLESAALGAASLDAAGTDADSLELDDSTTERVHAAVLEGVEQTGAADAGTQTYPVNDGGSLWRAGRKFLANDVVLDRLIDNLRASGMNVRRVFPGAEFQVDTVSDGHLVVRIEHGRESYVSRIIDGSVSTTVRRPVTVAIESSFVGDAATVGVEHDVIAEILARDDDMSLGVDNAQPGDHVRFELRETRNFGSPAKTTDIAWIEKNGERLWREVSSLDIRTVAWGD